MSINFDNDFFGFDGIENDAEFIPLITAEEEESVNKQIFMLTILETGLS